MNKLTLQIYDAIQAGKIIERSDDNNTWIPYTSSAPQLFIDIANEPENVHIRIKPKTFTYRPYLRKDLFLGDEVEIGLWVSSSMWEAKDLEKDSKFVVWLDEEKTITWNYVL